MENRIGSRYEILRIDLLFLFTSFFTSGTQSMVSQVFFAQYYPDQKYTLLSITLLLGSLATMAGMFAEIKVLRTRPRWLVAFVLLSITGFVAQLWARSIVLYLPAFLIASFSVNLLYNAFDNFFMRVVEPQARQMHIRTLLLYQMLGYILSPLFFSLFFTKRWLCTLAISALGIVSYYPALRLQPGVPRNGETRASEDTASLERKNRLFLAYVLSVYTGIYMFLAIAEYLLRDVYRYENSSLVCSVFLMLVVIISCVVIVSMKSGKNAGLGGRHFAALFLIAAAAFLLMARLSTHLAYLIVPCVSLGIGNGLFSGMTKQYANCCDQKTRVISFYNMSQTLASLCAYLLIFITSRVSLGERLDTNTLNLSLIIATTVLATLFFTLFSRMQKKEGG